MCRATHPTTLTAERTGGSASTRALEHLLAICSPAVLRAHSRCSIDRSSCPIVCVRQWCNSCLPSVVTVLYCTARFGSLALLAVDSCRGAPRPCAWCAGGCGPSRKVQMISFLQKLPWTWLPNLNEVRTCPAALCSSVCVRPARRSPVARTFRGAAKEHRRSVARRPCVGATRSLATTPVARETSEQREHSQRRHGHQAFHRSHHHR